jgi:hypothetical protein
MDEAIGTIYREEAKDAKELAARLRRRRLTQHIFGAFMDFQMLMKFAADREASDIHLQSGLSPKLRMQGVLHTVDQPMLTDEDVRQFVGSIAPPRMRDKLEERMTVGMDFVRRAGNLPISVFGISGAGNVGRFDAAHQGENSQHR